MDYLDNYADRRPGERCSQERLMEIQKNIFEIILPEYEYSVRGGQMELANHIMETLCAKSVSLAEAGVGIGKTHAYLIAAALVKRGRINDLWVISGICKEILGLTLEKGRGSKDILAFTGILTEQGERLFRRLERNMDVGDGEDEAERFKTTIDDAAERHLGNICNLADKLMGALSYIKLAPKHMGHRAQLMRKVSCLRDQVSEFEKHNALVYWLERSGSQGELLIRAAPKNLNEILYADLWSKGLPIILTSGTLSAEHIKRTMGLDKLRPRLIMETNQPSPFNYRDNALLYISDKVPFPDNKDTRYIQAVADEVELLVIATHGHTAVLFTSYRVMELVFGILEDRELTFPLFKLGKGNMTALERFRKSGNGVLFAAGTLWEGIDLPGDILSSLIIVKLPFSVPDPIGEYERSLYGSMEEYKAKVLIPDMQVKLKQGFGRLIRTETDTGVCAILDSRAKEDGAFHRHVLGALPSCRVVAHLGDVEQFICEKKGPAYFG